MLTSLIEMLELPSFGHLTTCTIWFESRDKILLVAPWPEIMMLWLLFQNTFILRRPRVANSADIIKITTMSIKANKHENK